MTATLKRTVYSGLMVLLGVVIATTPWLDEYGSSMQSVPPTTAHEPVEQQVVSMRVDISELQSQLDQTLRRLEDMDHRLSAPSKRPTQVLTQFTPLTEPSLPPKDRDGTTVPAEPSQPDSGIAEVEPHVEQQRQAVQKAKARLRTEAELIDETIMTEPIDREWANAAEQALEQAFLNPEDSHFEVLAAECSSSLCRVQFYLEDPASGQGHVSNLMDMTRSLPWSGESWFNFANRESGEATLYLAREDHALPREIMAQK